MISTAERRVVKGDRSSWLTPEANRASRLPLSFGEKDGVVADADATVRRRRV